MGTSCLGHFLATAPHLHGTLLRLRMGLGPMPYVPWTVSFSLAGSRFPHLRHPQPGWGKLRIWMEQVAGPLLLKGMSLDGSLPDLAPPGEMTPKSLGPLGSGRGRAARSPRTRPCCPPELPPPRQITPYRCCVLLPAGDWPGPAPVPFAPALPRAPLPPRHPA